MSRRAFIGGVAASGVLLACGDDDGGGGGSSDDLSIVRFFGPYYVAGETGRVPLGLADSEGILPFEASPSEVAVTVRDADGATVADGLTAERRGDGLPRPYYAFEFTPEADGFYDVEVDTGGATGLTQVQVVASGDATVGAMVGPGDTMPAILSPTEDDARGVTPICTREPACDLHGRTIADAIAEGPSVILVATPAFCQTVVCGPVLDLLLDVEADHPDLPFVHIEVYRDPGPGFDAPPAPEDFAPAVGELGLLFEPVLYTVRADGTVAERLDYVFDTVEMAAAVDRLVR